MIWCRMKRDDYEQMMAEQISGAAVLDHSKSPCEENFIPDTQVITVLQNMLKKQQQQQFIQTIRYFLSICTKMTYQIFMHKHISLWRFSDVS